MCDFCKALDDTRRIYLSARPSNSAYKTSFHAAFIAKTRHIICDEDTCGQTVGTTTSAAFPLNFCPVCGTKLNNQPIIK